jgi:hypothetical protein
MLVENPHSWPGSQARIVQGRIATSSLGGSVMTANTVVVGVDVAKDRLDVAVRPTGETWSAANDEAGITAGLTAALLFESFAAELGR